MRFMIINTCEIIDFINGGKINKPLYFTQYELAVPTSQFAKHFLYFAKKKTGKCEA